MAPVEGIAEVPARTGAGPGAEHVTTDQTDAGAQRATDDLIDHEQRVADGRLLRFRESADRSLAFQRSAAPAPTAAVAMERRVADEGKKAGRRVTDALLERERERPAVVVEHTRGDHQADRVDPKIPEGEHE